MHIASIRLRAFKRFADLTIRVPGTPHLVVMAGPNGTGKSSVLDGLRLWHGAHGDARGHGYEEVYHRRSGDTSVPNWPDMVSVDFVEELPFDKRKVVYVRSAYRHEGSFDVNVVQRLGELATAPAARQMIDLEAKVSDNYARLVSQTIDNVYRKKHGDLKVDDLVSGQLTPIRDALLSVFPKLELVGPGDPMGGGTFFFRKDGNAEFHYKNLSGGEKAVFDIILDFVVKAAYYDDTVICIDEPELHTNTNVQALLLQALFDLTPPKSQLWVATHSIGMMRAADEIRRKSPSEVVFLDFEDRAYIEPVGMETVQPDRAFWKRSLAVALGDLAELIAPDRVVLCEGRPTSTGNASRSEFDARCYSAIFASSEPRTDFVSVGSADDVLQDRRWLGKTIETIVPGTQLIRVIDRDNRSPQEISDLTKQGYRVLRRRQIESYLMDPEVIDALCVSVGKPEVGSDARRCLEQAIDAVVSEGRDRDDLKSASGRFYVCVRKLLDLGATGSSAEAFLAGTMAPLLQSGMTAYEELRKDIFGP
jgi:predicted ATPase